MQLQPTTSSLIRASIPGPTITISRACGPATGPAPASPLIVNAQESGIISHLFAIRAHPGEVARGESYRVAGHDLFAATVMCVMASVMFVFSIE